MLINGSCLRQLMDRMTRRCALLVDGWGSCLCAFGWGCQARPVFAQWPFVALLNVLGK